MKKLIELEYYNIGEDGMYWVIEQKKYSLKWGRKTRLDTIGMMIEEITDEYGEPRAVRYYYPKNSYPDPNNVPMSVINTAKKLDIQAKKEVEEAMKVLGRESVQTVEEKEPEKKEEVKTGGVFRF